MTGTTSDILFDIEDEPLVSAYKWHISDTGYAVWRGKPKDFDDRVTVRMHRLVMGAKPGELVDHLNGNRLDNRKSNLRICTHKENAQNRHTVRGFFFNQEKRKWQVTYRGNYYGRYVTPEEAREAYRLAKSGVPKAALGHPRRKYLPRGVYFMQPQVSRGYAPYYIRPTVDGRRKFIGYFGSVQQAKDALNNITAQGGLTS